MAGEAVKVPFIEAAAPSTPAASRVVVYAKSDGLMYSKDDAGTETLMSGGAGGGSVATDAIWDAAGDLVQGTGANTAAKLSAGTAGNFLKSAGAAAANVWAFPPGHELDYVQFTANVSVTGTSEGAADTVVTGTSQAYAAEPIMIEFFTPSLLTPATANAHCEILLYDGATILGWIGQSRQEAGTNVARTPVVCKVRLTPTAATHQYIIKAMTSTGTTTISAGTAGTGAYMAGYIRVTKV